MEKTENKPFVIGADAAPFKFELSQLVEMRISDEWGEIKARAQYADGENQYLYAHPEQLKSLTSRQRYNLDNNIATSDLLEMHTRLTTVGDGLFAGCVSATTFEGTFYGCTGLESDVNDILPAEEYPQITSVYRCFYNCRSLQGSGCALIEKLPGVTSYADAFYNCVSLSDFRTLSERYPVWV